MSSGKAVTLSAATGGLTLVFGALMRAWFERPSELDAFLADIEFQLVFEWFAKPVQSSPALLPFAGLVLLSFLMGAVIGSAVALVTARLPGKLWLSPVTTLLLCSLLQFLLRSEVTV